MDNKPITHNSQYSLSIRFVPDGFSLYVTDENRNIVVSRKVSAAFSGMNVDEILELLSAQEEINLQFGNVRFIVESSYYTLIPAQVFREDQAATFLKFQHPTLPAGLTIVENKLQAWDAVLIFAMQPALQQALESTLPESAEHHLSAFLNDNVPLSSDTAFYVRFRRDIADIILMSDAKPLIINSYECSTMADLLYYLLKITEQHKLNAAQCAVHLYNCSSKEDYTSQLEKHFLYCKTYN